jgi:TPR repeat protein
LFAIPPFGYAQSITELKSKAEDGDVQAQLAPAKAYHLGEGVAKDEAEAVRWWEKAAEHGDVAAQINLGVAYSHGAGVPKNYAGGYNRRFVLTPKPDDPDDDPSKIGSRAQCTDLPASKEGDAIGAFNNLKNSQWNYGSGGKTSDSLPGTVLRNAGIPAQFPSCALGQGVDLK